MNSLQALEKRVATLANHHQKYIHVLKQHLDSLIDILESSGNLMQVHLWTSSSHVDEEMELIVRLSDNRQTNIRHVSCYYALQFLHMNFRHQDILTLGISSGATIEMVYQQFMMNVGSDFRALSRAYMKALLDLYLPDWDQGDFFICGVGTRADQDDIDVGIVTRDDTDITAINQAMQNITHDMLVYATPLHHYLSEHIGEQLYSSTVSEYLEHLDPEIRDMVIISELIGSRFILGGEALFREFHEKVTSRYYYDPDQDIRYHEGFLRGILGEARAQFLTPLATDTISPKEDGLRIIKALLAAKRVVYGLEEVNAWDIIGALRTKEPHLSTQYESLFMTTSFLEILKFQLQMYVAQEDAFRLEEITPELRSQLADKMGYQAIGTVSAWDQLIIDYARAVKEARKFCEFLVKDTTTHLSSISIFRGMFQRNLAPSTGGPEVVRSEQSFAKDFIETARFFHGTRYWEDILIQLGSDQELQTGFIESLETLDEETKNQVIDEYTEWAPFSPISLMRLITILWKKQQNVLGDTVAARMSHAFLDKLEQLPYATERLAKIFTRYPQYIHEFLEHLPEPDFAYFFRIMNRPVVDENIEEPLSRLRSLCEIHEWSGHYFGRFFSRVIASHPEYLNHLTDSHQLHEIAVGLLALADVYPLLEDRKQALGEYYDLEFLRIGLGTMRGTDLRTTNIEFTEFCDNYMRKLFDVCTEEIRRESDTEPPSTDRFAVLVAGGHAREQAYDDDYDIIALVDTDDEDVIRHATRVMSRMNREILKRGLLPQYRLGEILGGFVNPMSRMIAYLESDDEDNFIDLSQLLGSRLIVGSERMRATINSQILDRFAISRKREYITRMVVEVRNRQNITGTCEADACNLKEAAGGLRDIEAIALMLKAYLEIHEPLTQDLFQKIRREIPGIADYLDTLSASLYYLRTIRDLYRITVAAEDTIDPDYLTHVGNIFRRSHRPELSDPKRIMEQIDTTLNDSVRAIDGVIWFLQESLSPEEQI